MPENSNLYALLRAGFADHLDRLAIQTPQGRQLTYQELDIASAYCASALASAGAQPGDRIAAQVDKSVEALILYLGCLRGGFVYLPLNTAYPEPELDYFIGDARPAVIVCRPDSAQMLESIASRYGVSRVLTLDKDGRGTLTDESLQATRMAGVVSRTGDDLAAILYTSGTTGHPKGAMLSHHNLASNTLVLHKTWGFQENDVLLHALPIFHTHGLFVACHTSLINATPMLFCPRFDVATVMELLPRATVMMGVPTFYVRLLAEPEFGKQHSKKMRLFISGSAPLLAQTFHEFEQRTGHRILERYGMTECGMSTSNPLVGERKVGTVGKPLEDVRLRVVDADNQPVVTGEVGRIQFIGPNVFKGYWHNPEKTAQDFTDDGFFDSGDLGSLDEDGYVTISGRNKDLIISGGYNIYPKEVELCLDKHDGVIESAVIGLAHADFGEQVAAVIVADPRVPKIDPALLIEQLKQELAGYKVPRQIFFIKELPRNAMGKVQKAILREQFAGS